MTLFVVSTPIGNLEDITIRALRVIKESDLIACEDTRRTQKLLYAYQIQKRLTSYHAHSNERRIREILEVLKQGKTVALVSDSGTPGISDPGYILIRRAIEQGIPVQSIPGPTALTAACACSGFPGDRFVFLGFLPRKKGKASRLLQESVKLNQTVLLYESPYRVCKTLDLLYELFGDTVEVVVARELTKKFEEILRGKIQEVNEKLKSKEIRGEIVILFKVSKNEGTKAQSIKNKD